MLSTNVSVKQNSLA